MNPLFVAVSRAVMRLSRFFIVLFVQCNEARVQFVNLDHAGQGANGGMNRPGFGGGCLV